MAVKNRILKDAIWSKKDYYQVARSGSLDTSHPAMKKLVELANNAVSILDMGCGEGTRLSLLKGKGKKRVGVDISPQAISLAQKKYRDIDFRVGTIEKLPFKKESFDLVYSAFVFEHLENPEKVLKEGIRVLKRRGHLLIVAPNFGAPNRASPPFKGNRFFKLLRGFIDDFSSKPSLKWSKVKPIATSERYEIDWDTVSEPYLGSLIKFLNNKKVVVEFASSCWQQELPGASLFQEIIRLLANLKKYPFILWGPHLLVVARKEKIDG